MSQNKISRAFNVGILTVLMAISFFSCAKKDGAAAVSKQLSVYDRVMNSGTLKASYFNYPPACMKDTVTGKMSGTFVDVLEKIAENTGLKLEWVEEVGWGSQIEGLNADRYDIVGSPVWANPNRGKLTTLSKPVYYSGIGIYARKDDTRFDKDWSVINDGQVRIATIDGETGDLIARTQFPRAKRISFPQLTDISQLFLETTNKKADLFFAEPYFAYRYFKTNPLTLKNIAEKNPIRVLGNCYMMKKNEPQLKQLIDTAIEDLLNSGYIDQLLAKYDGGSTFYRVGLPYREGIAIVK